jgi:hypothetical protein
MHAQERNQVNERLKDYISDRFPLGPVDADRISDPECSARLYEWHNTAFAKVLKGGSHVVIGRRGSGKSALLNAIRDYKTFFEPALKSNDEGKAFRDTHEISDIDIRSVSDFVLDLDLYREIPELQLRLFQGASMPYVELLEDHWRDKIFFCIGKQVFEKNDALWKKLSPGSQEYITGADVTEERRGKRGAPKTPREFADEINSLLLSERKSVTITFDSLEKYMHTDGEREILGGLLRYFGGLQALQNSRINAKICFPSEQYPEISSSISTNATKDLLDPQFLHWKAPELMFLAAHRLKNYLEVYHTGEYEKIHHLKLSDRENLREFWKRYLPPKITNDFGKQEEPFRYILRHTQMLPRHVIMILNSAFSSSKVFETGDKISESAIKEAVQGNEAGFRDTICQMFDRQYPRLKDVLELVLPRMKRVECYGDLEVIWRQSAQTIMGEMGKSEYLHFRKMLFSTGVLGVVQAEKETDVYIHGEFEFNTENELTAHERASFCVHPIFSRIYRCQSTSSNKPIISYDVSQFSREND